MKHFVLGTAGHIDHGKTSLVKTLSGVDTDRLKEEKERGITIDLGFASMQLPSGTILSIIDVPGHERFVRNMVAGASGIDMVLLVVAADDGIMPQTREHLDICSLLGIKHGLVAVTKADMVDDEWLTMTIDDIEKFLKGTFLEGAPVIPVSSVTGKGVAELISSLDSMAGKVKTKRVEGMFRLPVDRAFIIKGFGTVVTGTALSGRLSVGEEIELLPKGIKAKVRGIQTHGRTVQEGSAGSRMAINLQGIEREDVKRGDTIVSPGTLKPTSTAEVLISLLPSAPRPLKDRMDILLHFATSAVTCTSVLLGTKEIKPGEFGFARIKANEPITAMHGDRFVLRFSDAGTIGGGIFLDTNPPNRSRVSAIEELKILASDNSIAKALLHIKRAGKTGIKSAELSLRLNLPAAIVERIIPELTSNREVYKIDENLISAGAVKMVKDSIIAEVESYHKKENIKEGILREEIRSKLSLPPKILTLAINELVKSGLIVAGKDTISLSSYKSSGGDTKEKILKIYIDAGLTPPTFTELLEKIKVKEKEALDLLNTLFKEGKLAKVKDFFFAKEPINELQTRVIGFFKVKNEMTPVDFKEMTGLSRKFAIPLLEFLDSQKITIRVGDIRRLRKG